MCCPLGRSPPEADGAHLFPLPDAMYMRAPKSIAAAAPTAATEGGNVAAQSHNTLRIECGGVLRSKPQEGGGGSGGGAAGTLARIVVQYDRATGALHDMVYEEFPLAGGIP